MKRMLLVLCSLSMCSLLACGCTPIDPAAREQSVVLHEKRSCMLVLLLDLSPSFHDKMLESGKGYKFCISSVDKYFRERIGSNDEVVIGQISGERRALLWQGTPLQLRKDFPSPAAFNEFLRKKAVPTGSNVFDSIAQSVEYVASDPDVLSGDAKSAVLVLSDMADNDPNQVEARERLQRAFTVYADRGGAVGCYFVEQTLVAEMRSFLAGTGLRKFVVESEIVGNPQLPVIY